MRPSRSLLSCVFQRGVITLSVVLVLIAWCGTVVSQDVLGVDDERTRRYVADLKHLLKLRSSIREQCRALIQLDQSLEYRMRQAFIDAMTADAINRNTPALQASPLFAQARSNQRNVSAIPGLQGDRGNGLWFMVQDNRQLKIALESAAAQGRLSAEADSQALANHRSALLELADSNEENFDEFRLRVDWLGRRSSQEHEAALKIALDDRVLDTSNPGMALVEAASHRAHSDFGACTSRMDDIDDHVDRLQVLNMVFQLQIEYCKENEQAVKQLAKETYVLGKQFEVTEALLVRGWIAIANENWSMAHDCANAIRRMAPDYLEGAILKAWAIVLAKPKQAKDALAVLRSIAIRTNKDDWYFHEAMAFVSAVRGKWESAASEIAVAKSQCPSHLIAILDEESQAIDAKQVPKITWKDRLKRTWIIPAP